jgi:hypothetical protein
MTTPDTSPGKRPNAPAGRGATTSIAEPAPAATTNCLPADTRPPIAAPYLWEDDEVDGGAVVTLPHTEEASPVARAHTCKARCRDRHLKIHLELNQSAHLLS